MRTADLRTAPADQQQGRMLLLTLTLILTITLTLIQTLTLSINPNTNPNHLPVRRSAVCILPVAFKGQLCSFLAFVALSVDCREWWRRRPSKKRRRCSISAGSQSTRHTVNSSHPKIAWRVDHRVLRHCDELTVWWLHRVTRWPCIVWGSNIATAHVPFP